MLCKLGVPAVGYYRWWCYMIRLIEDYTNALCHRSLLPETNLICVRLRQNLGQEPVIFSKDICLDILKAMVEFLYCGEIRIPHQLLSPLLTATRTFKLKKPTTVVDATIISSFNVENRKAIKNMNAKDILDSRTTEYAHVVCKELLEDKHFCNEYDDSSSSSGVMNPSENISLERNASGDPSVQETEHKLYEGQDFESDTVETNSLFSAVNAAKESNGSCQLMENDKGVSSNGRSQINDGTSCNGDNDDPKPVPPLYEQCCDLSDVDECDESSMSLSESCLKQIERDFARYKFEGTDVPSKLGKFVKVYTHKRRKSIEEIKTKLTDVNNVISSSNNISNRSSSNTSSSSPPSTDCIDLLDEPSTNTDIPVTLLTSLDIESAEYIISLSTENIQSIVGATLTREPPTVNKHKKLKIIESNANEESKTEEEEEDGEEEESRGRRRRRTTMTTTKNVETSSCAKPILRRSSRLNQQEVEEIVNNNGMDKDPREKQNFKKSTSPNTSTETELLCIKKKRNKIKDVDRKVPEQQQTKKPLNLSRKNSKLIVKKNKCTKEKNVQEIREENKFKYDTSEYDSIFASPKLNTIEHISRALWGDMSDFSEDCYIHLLKEYNTPNTEIPFAVGLLPLRTALEKMQATPDYQPRKTRSSVAIATPVRQDIVGSFKRKRFNSYVGEPKEDAKAVCHIQIRTAPSQCVRNRKKYLPSDIDTLQSPPTIMNKH